MTPTPYAPGEATAWLALPAPLERRTHALLIDPAGLVGYRIAGPRWVHLGGGIEYVLLDGFPATAIVHPGWEIAVT